MPKSDQYRSGQTLIIGYGNLLRGDDAIGFLAASELGRYYRDDDVVQVLAAQQLTPEMAEIVAESSFVLFLDARQAEPAGEIRSSVIDAECDAAALLHQLTPATLVGVAQQLYGAAPLTMSLTLAGGSFELDDQLSPYVKAGLPEFIRQAKDIVASHRALLANVTIGSCSPAG